MREIKFRAKSMSKKDTKWYYGVIRSIAKDVTGFLQDCHKNCVHINANTIGQYTGLKDNNGKEIYEGDIVEAEYCIDGCLYYIEDEYGVIQWDDKQCGFNLIFKNQLAPSPISYYVSFKVVGNIYDTPELLEAQND